MPAGSVPASSPRAVVSAARNYHQQYPEQQKSKTRLRRTENTRPGIDRNHNRFGYYDCGNDDEIAEVTLTYFGSNITGKLYLTGTDCPLHLPGIQVCIRRKTLIASSSTGDKRFL